MTVIIISAMTAEGRVIGKDNALPWNIPSEMKLFREKTIGSSIIMGRKTFDSMNKKPLPKRNNIVISSTLEKTDGVDVVRSLDEALEVARDCGVDTFIIGGASVYEQGLRVATHMYLSFIKEEFEGDTVFPSWNEEEWKEVSREEREEFVFVVYEKVS